MGGLAITTIYLAYSYRRDYNMLNEYKLSGSLKLAIKFLYTMNIREIGRT